jgi:hypothetical protein
LPRQRIELLGRKPFEEIDIAQAEAGRLNVS